MIYIILSILLFSFNNVLWKKNLESISISFLVAYRSFFTSIISLVLLFYIYDLTNIRISDFVRITLGSVFGVIGLFSMLVVVKKASLQWLGIYNLIGIIVSTLFLFFFEKINFSKSIFGMAIIVIGFIFFIYFNRQNQLNISRKQHLLLLLMTLCFSISSLIHWKNLTSNFPPLLILSNQELVVFISAFVITCKNRKIISIRNLCKNYFSRVILMSFIVFLALLTSFLGLKITNPIISSVLFLASPLTTILFSYLFFKEKLSIKNFVVILIISFGTFILHYYSA